MSRYPLNILLLASVLVPLGGCVTRRQQPVSAAPAAAPLVFNEPVAERTTDSSLIRSSLQKAYYVGRIVDPKYPELMHGDGVIYRRERAEAWNLNSTGASGREDFLRGPIRALPNGSETPAMTSADAEIHEARTSAIVDALLEQNAELAQKLADAAQPANAAALPEGQLSPPPPTVTSLLPAPPHSAAPDSNLSETELVTIAPSADNIIELSPTLLEPPIPGLTNPFRQRYHFETQLRETKVIVAGIALGPQPSCVLGERIYNVGDSFETFTIAGIDADGIFLRKESFLLRIPMQDTPVILRYP